MEFFFIFMFELFWLFVNFLGRNQIPESILILIRYHRRYYEQHINCQLPFKIPLFKHNVRNVEKGDYGCVFETLAKTKPITNNSISNQFICQKVFEYLNIFEYSSRMCINIQQHISKYCLNHHHHTPTTRIFSSLTKLALLILVYLRQHLHQQPE